jgi:hypothetical protein
VNVGILSVSGLIWKIIFLNISPAPIYKNTKDSDFPAVFGRELHAGLMPGSRGFL